MKTVRLLLNRFEFVQALAQYTAKRHGLPDDLMVNATTNLIISDEVQNGKVTTIVEQARVELTYDD
jgi:hypothetical protein